MRQFFKFLVVLACLTTAAAFGQVPDTTATGIFPGNVAGRCILKSPIRTASTMVFTSDGYDADGFVTKLSAETGNRRLHFQLRCNGARITVRFSHPQLEAGSPPLAPNSNFYTEVTVTGAGNNGNTTKLESPDGNSEVNVIRNSYTGVRNMFVEFAVRNGGSANVPLLAGTYVFKFTATIEAGL